MKRSLKLSIVLSVFFLMPLSAFSESWWSPDRARINLRVGGSSQDGALDPGTMKGTSGGVTIMTAGYKDVENDRVTGGLSIHYVMKIGVIVGIHRYSSEFTSTISQTSDWAGVPAAGNTGSNAAAQYNSLYGGAGTALGVRKTTSYVNFLDLGYLYDMKGIVDGMSISGGIGLPLLGAGGGTDLVYGTTGYVLNGNIWTEEITASEGSASSYFVDFGYAFGSHEALFSLRNIATSGTANVDTTKGVGKVTGEEKFTSSGSSMLYSLGYGYIF